MQAKNLKKQATAKARSAALTPAQRSKIAAKAALACPKAQAGPPFGDPVSVRQKSFNACGKQPKQSRQ